MDLIALTRTKIITAIDSIQPRSGYKTVVVDEAGQRLLDLVLEKHVLLDRKCANVMPLEGKRAVENYLDVVYIVEPGPYALECISADYSLSPPRYAQAHIFLLTESRSMMAELSKRLGGRLATIKVADFSALPLERQVFSLGDAYSADMLYNANLQVNLKYISQMASQLYNLVEPFGQDPIIRYWNPPTKYHNSEAPSILANALQERVNANPPPAPSSHRTQVLVLDRSVDQLGPLLHEFTLQALAYDVLEFRDNSFISGDQSGKLDDNDTEWTTLRHAHISYAIEELTRRVAELKAANPHFGNNSGDAQVKVSDIRNMMAALPDFIKSKDSMAINLQVATDCMDAVEKNHLMHVADLEQAFALGSDSDGRKLGPEHVDKLIEFLGNKQLHKDVKLRLLMIYIISRGSGLQPSDYELLRNHARLEPYELEMLQNLRCWGTPTVKQGPSGPETKIPLFASENQEEQFLYARVTPGLKNILEHALANRLDPRLFPVVGDDMSVNDPGLTAANSLRNPRQRATWARASGAAAQKPKIFVFMLGGFTAAERRAVYEVSANSSRDAFLGGPDELTPAKYLRFLARQQLKREYLGLPCDAAPKKAPKHLYQGDQAPKAAAAPSPAPGGATSMPAKQPAQAPVPPQVAGKQAPPKADVLKDPGMVKEKEKKKHRFFKR